MIETTTGEIWNTQQAMEAVLRIPMAGKYAYRLAKIAKACTRAMETLVSQREELIKKHGTQEGQGYAIRPDSKNPEEVAAARAYADEWTELYESVKDEEVKLDVFKAFLPGDLTISASILVVLDLFIEIEAEVPKKE